MDKVIDLISYREAIAQRNRESGMMELEDMANALCEEAWHLLPPMRKLKIGELTIDSTGSILNIKYKDEDDTPGE